MAWESVPNPSHPEILPPNHAGQTTIGQMFFHCTPWEMIFGHFFSYDCWSVHIIHTTHRNTEIHAPLQSNAIIQAFTRCIGLGESNTTVVLSLKIKPKLFSELTFLEIERSVSISHQCSLLPLIAKLFLSLLFSSFKVTLLVLLQIHTKR